MSDNVENSDFVSPASAWLAAHPVAVTLAAVMQVGWAAYHEGHKSLLAYASKHLSEAEATEITSAIVLAMRQEALDNPMSIDDLLQKFEAVVWPALHAIAGRQEAAMLAKRAHNE